MLIDIHMHTSRYSNCGRRRPEEMLEAAIAAGLDAVVLTEHHVFWPEDELRALRRAYPRLRIFRGMEVTSRDGLADFLALGAPDPSSIERDLSPDAVVGLIHDQGGVAVLAHPFRNESTVPAQLLLDPPDAYERMSLNMPPFARQRASLLQSLLPRAHPLMASDAHDVAGVGAYAILLKEEAANERELAAAICEGDFRLVMNEDRLWEREPHWRRVREKVKDLAESGASIPEIRRRTGYTDVLVRHVVSGGDLGGW